MFINMLFSALRQLVRAECPQPVKRTFSKGEVMVNKEDNVFRDERDLKGGMFFYCFELSSTTSGTEWYIRTTLRNSR